MESFLKRLYPPLLVAAIFIVVGVTTDGSLDTIDYVATYMVFGFFYLPVLLERSIWEMIEISRPRFIRNRILTRRRKYSEKRPLNSFRFTNTLMTGLGLILVLIVPSFVLLGDAASVSSEGLSDSSVLERLLHRVGIVLSIVVFLTLLVSNLLRRYFVDWNITRRSELVEQSPGCSHLINIGLLIVLSLFLLMSSRFGQFISGNFGSPVLLIVQGLIALILWPGDRWLRNQR